MGISTRLKKVGYLFLRASMFLCIAIASYAIGNHFDILGGFTDNMGSFGSGNSGIGSLLLSMLLLCVTTALIIASSVIASLLFLGVVFQLGVLARISLGWRE